MRGTSRGRRCNPQPGVRVDDGIQSELAAGDSNRPGSEDKEIGRKLGRRWRIELRDAAAQQRGHDRAISRVSCSGERFGHPRVDASRLVQQAVARDGQAQASRALRRLAEPHPTVFTTPGREMASRRRRPSVERFDAHLPDAGGIVRIGPVDRPRRQRRFDALLHDIECRLARQPDGPNQFAHFPLRMSISC